MFRAANMTTTALTELPWNLVTRNLHGHELLRKKLRQKISKLERLLQHFPADAVHLHIALERNPKKEYYTAALTLRVPSNILRSRKSSPDLIKAFDEAVRALQRELAALKSQLRRETFWKRKARRGQLHQLKATGFAPQPQAEGTGPQDAADVLRELLQQHHAELLRYVRRYLWHEVRLGDVPEGAIDARAVVDEVARRALAAPENKPAESGLLLWFYRLARQELSRRFKALEAQAQEAVPLEEPHVLPEDAEAAAGYEPEQPLDIVEEILEPPVVETKDLIPDARTAPPDEVLAHKELLEQLQKTANSWPKPEREAFELHFVEGFEPDEVAMVLGLTTQGANELLASIRGRMRDTLLAQSAV
jgi:ribosomal subunit interface protein